VKGRVKRLSVVLVLPLSFAVLFSSVHFCYYVLASADFISKRHKIEGFDQDYLLAAAAGKPKVFGPSSFSILSALCFNPVKQTPLLPFLISPFNQRVPILRC